MPGGRRDGTVRVFGAVPEVVLSDAWPEGGGGVIAAQLRRAVMPPDILELQEEINDLRRRRREHYVRLFEMPPLSGCFELEVEPASHGAVLG